MDSDTFNYRFNLIFSFIFGALIWFYNVSRIPSSDGMGGIGTFFIATISALSIYIIALIVSSIVSKSNVRNENTIQLSIFILCVSFIYYSTWKICVYRKYSLTIEEKIALNKENEVKYNEFYKKIPKLIERGNTYRPVEQIVEKDSLLVLNSLRLLTGKPFAEIDSLSKIRIGKVLEYRLGYFFEDNLKEEVSRNLATISQSLKVRNLFYSPDSKVFLLFISFKTKFLDIDQKVVEAGDAIALIGYKKANKMILYKYFKLDYNEDFITNDDIAYSYCFHNAIGNYIYPDRYPNFLKSSFWKKQKVLRYIHYGKNMLYGFEAYLPDGEKKYKLIAPVLILDL